MWDNPLSARQLRDRYLNDPRFHALVTQFLVCMEQNKILPYEVKDAAFVAELIYHDRNVRPMYLAMSDMEAPDANN